MTTGVKAATAIRSDLKRIDLDARVQGYRAHGCELVVIMAPKFKTFDAETRMKLFRLGELYGFAVRKDNRFKKTVLFTVKDH